VVEHAQQFARIILHRPHADALEHARKGPFHRAAILEHIAHAGGTTPVVFEHQILALVVADQVRAADVNVNIFGHVEVHELAPEMFPERT